jgi:hypothetical protein
MNDESPGSDEPDPAARRASELLLVLREVPPTAGTGLTHRILRQARVQRAIAAPLRLLGTFAAAFVDGLRAAARTSRRRS